VAFFLSFFLCREVKGILKRVQNDGEFAKGLYFHLTRLVTLNSFQGLMVITWSRNVINYMFYSVLFSRGVSRQSRVAQDILKSVFCLIKKGRKKSRLQFLSSKTCIKGKFSGRAPPSLPNSLSPLFYFLAFVIEADPVSITIWLRWNPLPTCFSRLGGFGIRKEESNPRQSE